MDKKLTIALALSAGLLGGMLSRYIAPPVAFAQNQPQLVLDPVTKEVRAQSFTLVDALDNTIGTFLVEPLPSSPGRRPGQWRIVLRDSEGREIWSAGNTFRALSGK